MPNKNPFVTIAAMAQTQQRIVESLGVPYADPFNEIGVITDVNDPKKEGRVKVQTDDGFVSDWILFAGSNQGTLSARYIGAKVLIGKTNGRSENMYVIGVIRNGPTGVSGSPTQLPILDESTAVWNGSTDPGMRCNQGNEGRMYVLSNEMNQDVVVCLRRTSNQTGSKPAWAWKSLTNGLWVEKGFNPGTATTPAIAQAQEENPGIPECSEALLGEVHEFAEDRRFRTLQMRCKRDENGDFSWEPVGSAPVFFRTTLPNCSEKLHGMEAVLDDGNNSEFLICQRYQGKMSWVKQGKREPHRFFSREVPLSRIQFTSRFKDIPALAEQQTGGYDWVSEIADTALDTAVSAIPLTGTDPRLRSLLLTASLIPSTAFGEADTLSAIARESLLKRTGIPVESLFEQILAGDDPNSALSLIGDAADVLINGATTPEGQSRALQLVGRSALQKALSGLSPESAAVFSSLLSGGIIGALDSAVALGLDKLPDDVAKYVSPILDVASGLISSDYPSALSSLLGSSVNGGINSVISNLVNASAGRTILTPALLDSIATGGFGPISQLFSSLGNLDSILKLPGEFSDIPRLMSTALGTVGLADSLTNLFGIGGIGLEGLSSLLGQGFNAASLVVGGIQAFQGIFGSSLGCPCDPRCRKTSHGRDSDGNNLLEKCGALTANGANTYSPTANPLLNNSGPIAELSGLAFTGLGQELVPPNFRDLTSSLSFVPRVREAGSRIFSARNADSPESWLELAYSFEALEKALKVTDNNITRVESVERKLIDSVYNILQGVIYGRAGAKAVLPELIDSVRANSLALRDLYAFVKRLDKAKRGPRVGVRVTPRLASSFRNISGLSRLATLNRREALRVLRGGIIPADREWRTMAPGLGFPSLLGQYTPTIPDPYPNERTLFDSGRVLALSLESKLDNNPQPPDSSPSLFNLSQSQIGGLDSLSILDAISQREGKTSCE